MGDRMTAWQQELQFARRFAEQAGDQIRRIVAAGNHIDTKADLSPVTTADRLVNHQFIDQVKALFNGDGTRQLILAIPVFMVSIALVHDGRPVVAAAHNPSTRQTYWAGVGAGAYRDGTRLRVSTRTGRTEPATVAASGSIAGPAGLNADTLLNVKVAADSTLTTTARRFPWPTVFTGCKIAEGAWDGDLYSGQAAHDVAAVCLLVREAGGTVTDRLGNDQRYDRPVSGCIMSNGHIHKQLTQQWSETYVPRRA
jgi:fructose-1,6-bisphosphatase/inositol monophosphatase family enzyme